MTSHSNFQQSNYYLLFQRYRQTLHAPSESESIPEQDVQLLQLGSRQDVTLDRYRFAQRAENDAPREC